MASLTETVQTKLRAVTGTVGMYNEDWHAYADSLGIAAGQWGERVLAIARLQSATVSSANAAHYAFLHNTLSIP